MYMMMGKKTCPKMSAIIDVAFEPSTQSIRIMRHRFYTIGEIALILGVSSRSVRRYIWRGSLKAITYGENGAVRVTGVDLLGFIRPFSPKKNAFMKKVQQSAEKRARAPTVNPRSPELRSSKTDHK